MKNTGTKAAMMAPRHCEARWLRRLGGCFLAAAVSFASVGSTAHAESAAAQALFDAAVTLREAGNTKAACDKFEESLRLDPAVGTRFHLADCYERVGQLASAWASFTAVADESERDGEVKRAEAARTRAGKLKPRLARITVVVAAPAPGLTLKRGDVAVGDAQWGIAVPIDSQTYRFTASAPGHTPWSREITVKDGQSLVVNVPLLQKAAAAAPTSPPDGGGGFSSVAVTGLVLGGIGLVGIGVGAGFGAVALSKKSEVDELCPDLSNCNADGIAANDDGKQAATISTIGFIAGGAFVATGLILLVAGAGGDDTSSGTGNGTGNTTNTTQRVWPVVQTDVTADGVGSWYLGVSGRF